MARYLTFLATPLVWLVTAGGLFAQSALLNAIPADALGLVMVNNLADASARINKLTQKMNIPAPELLPIVKMFTGAQQGVDDKGTLGAAAFAEKDEDSEIEFSVAVFVPVSDYQVFVKQLQPDDADAAVTEVTLMGAQYLVGKKGEFAVLVQSDEKDFLQRVLSEKKGVAANVEPLRAWLADQQFSLVVTPAGKKLLFEKLGDLLEVAGKSADDKEDKDGDKDQDDADAKDDAGEEATVTESRIPKELLPSLKSLLASAEAQLTHLAVGIRIDEQTALHVAARILFTPEGKLSQWAQNVKPPKAGLLAGLPASKFVIAYGGVTADLSPEVAKLISLLTDTGMNQLGISDELRQKFAAITARQRANQRNSCGLLGTLRPGDAITATSVTVEHVKSATEHLKLLREQFAILQTATPKGDTNLPVYEVNELTVGDLKAVELVTDMSAMFKNMEADNPIAGILRGVMNGVFGTEGKLRAYFTAADETHVVGAYSKELLQHGVAHICKGEPGLEADAQIAKTAALLPQGAQWAAYASPQGLVQWADSLLRQALPPEMNFRLPPFPPSDPIGLAAKVSESGVDGELVLSESVVAGIGQYVILVQQMFQNNAAPLP